jgi:hypothetical protein
MDADLELRACVPESVQFEVSSPTIPYGCTVKHFAMSAFTSSWDSSTNNFTKGIDV